MSATVQEIDSLEKWLEAARVYPEGQTMVTLHGYMKEHDFPFTFEAINAAVGSSDLQGKLIFRRAPSPPNHGEIIKEWLKTLPEGLRDGLPNALTNKVASIIETEFDNVYSAANLNAAYSRVQSSLLPPPEVKPEPSKKSVTDALMGQGGRQQTGRVNHAHDADAPAPLTDQQLMEGVVKTLTGLANGGHPAFAKQTNSEVKQMRSDGKSWRQIHQYVDSATTDYLAGAAIVELLASAPGATNGEKISNREHLQRIVRQGQIQNMSKGDIVKLVRLEFEGMTSRSIR